MTSCSRPRSRWPCSRTNSHAWSRPDSLTAVPPFASLVKVQDKVSARSTLEKLGIAQPQSVVVHDMSELASWTIFPAYVKAPIGTGSTGVTRVVDAAGLAAAFSRSGKPDDGGVRGRRRSGHARHRAGVSTCGAGRVSRRRTCAERSERQRVGEGRRGSTTAARSPGSPAGSNGMADFPWMPSWGRMAAFVIDVNARLVEPASALAAGTDLVATFLDVRIGRARRSDSPRPWRACARTSS